MTTDRIAIYNVALASLGERSLTALTESQESRRLLDEVWTRGGGAIKACLEQGLWNFAIRASQVDASSSISPAFGYANAFDKPTDFVRLVQLSPGEYFVDPLNNYEFEAQYIYADVDPIYIRYVSDDASYGNDLSLWPESFTLWMGHWMGVQIAPRLKNDLDMEKLEKRAYRLLVNARSRDAQQEPARFLPLGSWVRARSGRSARQRGSRNQLIG